MPKLTVRKTTKTSKPVSRVAKSTPAALLKGMFGDEKPTRAKVRAVVNKAGKTAAELRKAKNLKAKKALAKEAKGLIGANKKATRKPALKIKAKKVVRRTKAKKVVEAVKPVKTKFTQATLIAHLAGAASTDKGAAKVMLAELKKLMLGSIAPHGLGVFLLPGVLRIITRKVPARKGGKMVLNRFTGEMVKQKAKAATVRVKIRPLAALKTAAL